MPFGGHVTIYLNHMHSPKNNFLANLLRNLLAKLVSDSPLATWRVVSAIPARHVLTIRQIVYEQCSKLSIYFVHTLGAEGHRIVHLEIVLCAQAYILYRNTMK